ncbi:MAG: hypothetical protein JWM57_3340 [Phycisphaerales bacterium]|nr:hypothetical protein [Phycisphaerales bacterium]
MRIAEIKSRSRAFAAAVVLGAALARGQALPAPEPRFALTVYSNADPATFDPKGDPQQNTYPPQRALPGYGVVRERREIDLKSGINTLRFSDVAAGIDPTTVSFESLTDPAGTAVLEQNYEFDLVSSAKLLEKYIDKAVVVERPMGDGKIETIEGTLLSAAQGLVIKTPDGGVRIINGYSGIRVADAAGLITKPTLVWQLTATKEGKHDALVTYQTSGLTWRADYNIVLNEKNTAADVGAWVTMVNRSGVNYPDTRLKLVAGDVQRVTPPQRAEVQFAARAMRDAAEAGAGGFVEKSLFEYHLYTLGRTTSLPDNSTKQIELFEKKLDVPAKKVFVYYGLPEQWRGFYSPQPYQNRDLGIETNKKVDVYISIDNKEAAGLGIPLPAGRVRVYQRDDTEKTAEFVGEDVIQHTPKDEKLLIRVGSAFDIVGERKQTDFTVNVDGHVITESFEIKLRNHKKEAVSVIVKENLFRWANWEITAKSDAFEKQDYRTVHFPVDVPADGEKVVTYTVKYTW